MWDQIPVWGVFAVTIAGNFMIVVATFVRLQTQVADGFQRLNDKLIAQQQMTDEKVVRLREDMARADAERTTIRDTAISAGACKANREGIMTLFDRDRQEMFKRLDRMETKLDSVLQRDRTIPQ